MIGAGVFAAIGPAAAAAGGGLLIGLGIAAVVAACNATSSARLAALYPESGGTYVYGSRRLGPVWGYLAGWGFVVGKTASCAAMALTFGAYAAPNLTRPLAVAAVVAVTVVDYHGVTKTARATRVLVAVVLATLAAVVVACLCGETAAVGNIGDLGAGGLSGVLRAGGLLFFAFAGYARIATLGEEVVEPARTIPRAIPIALAITLAVYTAVAVSALLAAGPAALAASTAPLSTAVRVSGFPGLVPVVRVGAAVASLGVLVSLLAGVSRTVFAMAADGNLPRRLAAVHERHRVPHRAAVTVGAVVVGVVVVVDVRGAIGFSSFTVLTYYAIANAAALTLREPTRRHLRLVAAAGVTGCVVLALTLPLRSSATGAAVLAAGLALYALRRWSARRSRPLG